MSFMEELKFCCEEKRRLLTNFTIFKTLEVDPLYVVFKKVKRCSSYRSTVSIRNIHTHPRTIQFRNNFPSVLKAVHPEEVTLRPCECISVDIFFEPTAAKVRYEHITRYSFIIHSEHPKFGYDVPVLIKPIRGELSVPNHIVMPTTSPRLPCYFAFPLMNFTSYSVTFKMVINPKVKSLRCLPCQCIILKGGLSMIFLEAESENMCPVRENLIIRFSNSIKSNIQIEANIEQPKLYPSERIVRFPRTQLGVKVDEAILLCNESDEVIKYKWCRRASKEESQVCPNSICPGVKKDKCPPYVKKINDIFEVRPKGEVFTSVSSESALFSFTPPENNDEECQLYEFTTDVYLACSTTNQRTKVTLIGVAEGPQIELMANEKDLGQIYVGERQCCEVTATNSGKIKGQIEFFGTDGRFGGIVETHPNCEELEPKQSVVFMIQYFARSIGQFIETLCFKIKNSKRICFTLKGYAVPLHPQIFPNKLNFGCVPFGILQKQYLEITNVLKIPVVASLRVPDNGVEPPMILFIDEEKFEEELNNQCDDDDDDKTSICCGLFSEHQSHAHFSFWTLDPSSECRKDFQNIIRGQTDSIDEINSSNKFEEEYNCDCEEECCHVINYEDFGGTKSARTTNTFYSRVSMEFHQILDDASLLAVNLVTKAVEDKIVENPEADNNIITTILDQMYAFEYVGTQVEKMNYVKKNWSKTSDDPREIFLDAKSLYIEPLQTRRTVICVVANTVGLCRRNLIIRITPVSEHFEGDSIEICSHALSVTVPITYNCVLPVLHLTQTIYHIETYLGISKQFSLRVKNLSKVAGFVCFNIIPKNNVVELLIYPRKFLIKAEGWRKIYFKVTPFKIGETYLTGIIGILGNIRPIIYKIIVNSKPAAISVEPNKIKSSVRVLEDNEMIIKITNITLTEAQVDLSLEKSTYMHVNPKKAKIPPEGTIHVTLSSHFQESCKYENSLSINVAQSGETKVNICYDIQGIPLLVECCKTDVKNGMDFGTIFTSSKPFQETMTMKNCGEMSYTLFITKKSKQKDPKIEGVKFNNRSFLIHPGETKDTIVEIARLHPQEVEDEFYFDVIKEKHKCRTFFFTSVFKAEFVKPIVKWSKSELCFDIKNTEICDEPNIFTERVKLENKSTIQSLTELQIEGSFKFLDTAKGKCTKNLKFCIEPKDSKAVVVNFIPGQSTTQCSALYQGKVFVKSGGKKQESLDLLARILFPVVEITEEELTYFARKQAFYSLFKIGNPGELTSVYKWRLIEEIEQPVKYVNTLKMKEQKNISTEILTKLPNGLLEPSINVEQEYLDGLILKFANINEENDDVESENENKVIKKPIVITASKDLKKVGNKLEKGGSKNESIVAESLISERSLTESEAFNIIINEIIEKLFSTISVDMDEIADDAQEFLNLNFPKNDMDNILENLEPEDCTTEISEPDKYIYLDHYSNCIEPECSRIMNIFFAGHEREVLHSAKYELEVAAGNTSGIDVNVYNINAAIQISDSKFDFGCQPWYKIFQKKIKLTNNNEMTLKINIAENAYLEDFHKLYKGFVTVKPNDMFYILNDMIVELTVTIYMGFSFPFNDGFGIEVNNNIATPVLFTGKTLIPMVSVLNIERPFLESIDRNIEYKALNKMFLKEVDFIQVSEPPPPNNKELYKLWTKLKLLEKHSSSKTLSSKYHSEAPLKFPMETPSNLSDETYYSSELPFEGHPTLNDLYIDKDGRILKFKNSRIENRAVVITELDKDLEDFHVLDYPPMYPSILYIEKMIETYRFLEQIKFYDDIREDFTLLARKYVIESSKRQKTGDCKPKALVKIRDLDIDPLPFFTTSYYLPFEYIRLNEELSVSLELFSHGPGKVAIGVRTLIPIPGFQAEFAEISAGASDPSIDIKISNELKFSVYTAKPIITQKHKYMNKTERDMSSTIETDEDEKCQICVNGVRLCRKHSYDINLDGIHTRELPDRKAVYDYYSNYYKKRKSNLILCQLFQEGCEPADETIFELKITFEPTEQYYADGMIFEEYLFIDVHLGITIPILLRGPIKSSNYSPENLCEELEEDFTEPSQKTIK